MQKFLLKAPKSSNASWRWSNFSSWHTREIILRSFYQPHHRSNNPLRVEGLTVQRINLGYNREGTLSASHNVVLIPADDRSALPVCFRAREETRPCPCRDRIVLRGFPFERSLIPSALLHWTCPRLASRLNRGHESRAESAIEFRTGAPTSRISSLSYRTRLLHSSIVSPISDTRTRSRGTSYRNRSHLEISVTLTCSHQSVPRDRPSG